MNTKRKTRRSKKKVSAQPRRPYAQGDDILTIEETADRLRITPRMVWRLRAAGELPPTKIGGLARQHIGDVEALIARNFGNQPDHEKAGR